MTLHRALTRHCLWCCPRSAHRPPGQCRGVAEGARWPPSSNPVTSFWLREPSPLENHGARRAGCQCGWPCSPAVHLWGLSLS